MAGFFGQNPAEPDLCRISEIRPDPNSGTELRYTSTYNCVNARIHII